MPAPAKSGRSPPRKLKTTRSKICNYRSQPTAGLGLARASALTTYVDPSSHLLKMCVHEARGAPLENTVSPAEPSECLIFHNYVPDSGLSPGLERGLQGEDTHNIPWSSCTDDPLARDSHRGGGTQFVTLPNPVLLLKDGPESLRSIFISG